LSHAKLIAEISRTKFVENATTHYLKSSSSHNRTSGTPQHGRFPTPTPQNANIQDILNQSAQPSLQKKDSIFDTSQLFSNAEKTIKSLKKKTPFSNKTDSDIRFTKHRPENLDLYPSTITKILPSNSLRNSQATPDQPLSPHTENALISKGQQNFDQKISIAKFQKTKEANERHYLMHYSNSSKKLPMKGRGDGGCGSGGSGKLVKWRAGKGFGGRGEGEGEA
jgi:hypothetical protein